MSKIISFKVYLSYLPDNKIAVSFIANDRYSANLFVNELKDCEKIEVSAKAHKEARSIKQNKFLWAIISKMSEKLNGEKTEESTMKIYGDLLVSANVKRDLIAILPIAIETIKSTFRAVIPTGQYVETINEKKRKESTFKYVLGVSRLFQVQYKGNE